MSLNKSEFNNMRNPLINDNIVIDRDGDIITLNNYNIRKYFQDCYILCLLSSQENIINLTFPFINKDFYNKCKDNLILYKTTSKILKNKIFYDRFSVIKTSRLVKFNKFGYNLPNEIIFIPILNIPLLELQNFVKMFDGISNLKEVYNLLVLSDYFYTNKKNLRNSMYISNKIKNMQESKYWTYGFNCGLNITEAFKNRKFNFSVVKCINKYKQIKSTKNVNSTEVQNNYLEMTFSKKKYTDIASVIKRKGFILYKIPKKCEYTKNDINNVVFKLDNFQRFLFFSKLLISKKYCLLALNNKVLLTLMMPTIHKFAEYFRIPIGYAWISAYYQESAKKRNMFEEDDYIFDIGTANLLPVYPMLFDEPQLNPYMPILVSKKELNSKNNICGLPTYLNSEFQNKGITTLDGFKKRLNVLITSKNSSDIFAGISFTDNNMAIVGSSLTACCLENPPILELFNIEGMNTFDQVWSRYFNELYSGVNNKKGDIDIQIVSENPLLFIKKVRNIYSIMTKNFCNIFKPYAKECHIKLNPIKTIFLFVSETFVLKNICDNDVSKCQNLINNLYDKDNIDLFKPYFSKRYEKYLKDTFGEISEKEYKEIQENYPEFFQMENVIYQVNIKRRKYIKSKNDIEEENISDSSEEKSINNEESDDKLGMVVSVKFLISSPMLNRDFEIFAIRKNHLHTVATFHCPNVRAYYTKDNLFMTPSFISSMLTFMNLDWRYVAGKLDICNIINKQRMRMFGTWLNKKEIKEYINYNSNILFWNNLYNINMNDSKTISECLGTVGLNKKLYRPRFFNMDFYMLAQPIDLNNPYNEKLMGKTFRTVNDYNDYQTFLKNKYDSIDLNELRLFEYKVIDPETGYVQPLKDNIIELVYSTGKKYFNKDN